MTSLFAKDVDVQGYARVAVERGLDRFPDGLAYGIPASLRDLQPGERVMVPLGRGDTLTPGYVIERIEHSKLEVDRGLFKPIHARDKSGAKLPAQLLELARWISSYYCAPIGMTLASMVPAAVKRNVGSVRKVMVDFAAAGQSEGKLSIKQRKVLDVLSQIAPERRPVEINSLAELAELKTKTPITRLIDLGVLTASRKTVVEATWAQHAIDQRKPERLTDEQARVISSISSQLHAGFSTHLLFGVTGSGKTEVYIRLIEEVVTRGKVAMMLVPEISLTPQTGGRLIGRFPNHRVAVLHSGLTAAQRHEQWALASAAPPGGAHIILGARSAVFAPTTDNALGLIIVDEEHDGSYKQDQVPRYHGRDVAIRRAQLARCPIILGSATPSLESWHNATTGGGGAKSTLHLLRQRAPGLRLPKVQVVNFRDQMKSRQPSDKHVHLIGPALEAALARTLEADGQALILLNRRGYANYIACPSSRCGWVMTCDHCDVTVVYHINKRLSATAGGYVRCHHCLTEQKLPALCPQCNSKISTFGLGTQRVEEELARKFPLLIEGKTMLRVDSDSMHGSSSFHQALKRFGEGEIRVLLGTQMIAKGLDFPGVRLVGVINADTSLHLPDFRAMERTFQLVNQVAGRCGRGAEPGLTIVQTFNPASAAIQLAAAHDFEGFAALELAERTRCGLPPISRMARIVVRDDDFVSCVSAARSLAAMLNESAAARPDIKLRGPAPCPIARIADKHRQQIEVIAPSATLLHQFLTAARSAHAFKSGAEMAIDVDPIALL